jgi:hypothetical protein
MRPPRRGSVMALGRFTLSAICTSSNAEPAHLSVQLRALQPQPLGSNFPT